MNSNRLRGLCVAMVVAVFLPGCGDDKPPDNPTPTPVDPAQCGALSGVIRFDGTPPARKPVAMSDQTCQREAANVLKNGVQDERCILTQEPGGNGFTMKNAFVWISKGLEGRAFARPTTPVVLDQKGCMFTPHVMGVMAWQELSIRNSDPVAHNTSNASATANKRFNVTLGSAGATETKRFGKPEAGMRFACDVHPWMDAYIHVVENPHFMVTDSDGKFALGGSAGAFSLPQGAYTVSVWTQTLGTVSVPVTVVAGKLTEVNVPAFKATKE